MGDMMEFLRMILPSIHPSISGMMMTLSVINWGSWRPAAMIAAMLLLLVPAIAPAQGWHAVTGEVGYEYGLRPPEEEIADTSAGLYESSLTSKVSDYNHTYRLGFGLLLPEFLGPAIELEVRGSAAYSTIALTGEAGRFSVVDPYLNTVDAAVGYQLIATGVTLGLDLLGRWRLPAGINLESGFWLGYRVQSTLSRYSYIIDPPTAVFSPEMTRQRNVEAGSGFHSFPLSAGMTIGYVQDFPVNDLVTFRSAIRLRTDFSRLAQGVSWRSVALGGGIGFVFNGNPSPVYTDAPSVDPSRSLQTDEAQRQKFRAAIDLYSLDDAGERLPVLPVRQAATTHVLHVPFVPVIYFDAGSERIPDRYMLSSPASGFSIDSLAGADPLQLHHSMLNVLGLRLRNMPEQKVRLMGGVAPGEPRNLGRLRAERVREYLRDVWGVDGSRMTVEAGETAGPRVQALGGSRELSAPVAIEWKNLELDAPEIGVSPSVEGAGSVRSWDLVIRHGNREVLNHSSEGGGNEAAIDMGLILRNLDRSVPGELVAELSAIDSTGEFAIAHDRLPIVLKGGVSPAGERRRTTFVLFAPAAGLPRSAMPSIESIAEAVRSGDRITIGCMAAPKGAAGAFAGDVAAQLRTLLRRRGLPDVEPELLEEMPAAAGALPEDDLLGAALMVIVDGRERPDTSRQ